jgi:hypothetical protein
VAYGARLESALSESSRGFESPILREQNDRLSGGLFCLLGLLGWIRTFAGAPSASRSGDFGDHSPLNRNRPPAGRFSLLRESLRRRISLSGCRHKLADFAEAEWRHVHIDVFALARIDHVGFVVNTNGRGASRRFIERLPSG